MKAWPVTVFTLLIALNNASLCQNAVSAGSSVLITNLVDMLPYVEEFTKQLDLDVSQPLTTNQITKCSPYLGHGVGIGVYIGNRIVFSFDAEHHLIDAYLDRIHSVHELSREQMKALRNHPTITQKVALEIARKYLLRLGYSETNCPVLPPRVTQEQWQLMGEERSDSLPFFTVEWPWKYAPDREYFVMEVDGIRLRVNHFFTLHGSPAEESLQSFDAVK